MPDIGNKVLIHGVRREVAQACSRRLEHTLFEEANAGMTQIYERYNLLPTTDHRTDQPSVRTVGSMTWPNNFFLESAFYPDDTRTAFLNCAK